MPPRRFKRPKQSSCASRQLPLATRYFTIIQPILYTVEGCDGLYRKTDIPSAEWDGKTGLIGRIRVYATYAQAIFKRAEDIEKAFSEIPGFSYAAPLKLPLCDACGEPSMGSVVKGDSLFCWECVKL